MPTIQNHVLPNDRTTGISRFIPSFVKSVAYITSMLCVYSIAAALGYAGLVLAGLVIAAPLALEIISSAYNSILNTLYPSRSNSNRSNNMVALTLVATLATGVTFGVSLWLTAIVALTIPGVIATTTAIGRALFGNNASPTQTNQNQNQNQNQNRNQNQNVYWNQLANSIRNSNVAQSQASLNQIATNFPQGPYTGLTAAGVAAIDSPSHFIYFTMLNTPRFAPYFDQNNNRLLRQACFAGRTEIVRSLLEHQHVRLTAGALNNEALRYACQGGHTEIIRQLLACPNVIANVTFNHNEAARIAENRGHFEIVDLLLNVRQVREYVTPVNAQFNITVNEDGPNDHLPNLVAPSRVIPLQPLDIRFQYHPDQSNAYLNNFLRNMHNYRPDHLTAEEQNLRDLASRRENAMAALNANQHEAIRTISARYQNTLAQRGIVNIFAEIEEFLRGEYRRKPIKDKGSNLPFEYQRNLTNAQEQLYYQNKTHTAFRFLFLHPNPWINPNAPFARRHAGGGASANISDADKTKIALMWLAATDKNQPIPEGFTRASIKKQFTDILAQIGRAHNWDRSRRTANGGTEEYDDLEGDNPSCGMGVSQRVVQFLMVFLNDRPESRPLSADIIKAKFREELIAEGDNNESLFSKLNALNKRDLNSFDTDFDNWCNEDFCDREKLTPSLRVLEPTAEAIDAFIENCRNYYGAARINARDKNINHHGQNDSFASYIRAMAEHSLCDFAGEINAKVQALKNPPKAKGKAKKHKGKENDEPNSSKTLTFSKPSKHGASKKKSSKSDASTIIPKPKGPKAP